MIKKILLVFFVLLLPTATFALMINYDNTSPSFETRGVTNFKTFGDMMDGMTVTAYSGDTFESAIWGDTASGNGAAVGSFFSLSESSDTFGGLWTLSTTSVLTSIMIDAGAGNAVFDVISNNKSSPGSSLGLPFEIDSASVDVDVTYSGAVSVEGTFYGDLYRYLEIEFMGDDFFDGDDSLSFIADTDNLIFDDDLTDWASISDSTYVPEMGSLIPVPEPSTFFLLGGGLACLALVARRRE